MRGEIIAALSVGEIVAVASLVLTLLGVLGGATWWMASLHALVRQIRDELYVWDKKNERAHDAIWKAIGELRAAKDSSK